MEKFNKYKPKNASDALAILFLIIAVISTFLFEVKMVLPHIHTIDETIQYFHICAGIFIIFNIFSNLLWLITTNNSTSGLLLPSILKPNWHFCHACEANCPPRAYHCHICDKCILKRDHHCVFSGCCIGYKNFRYYFGLLVYIAIGGLYASVLNQFFIWEALGGLSLVNALGHLLPFPYWLLGRIPFEVMVWTFISMVDICGSLFALALVYYHGMLLIHNQTTHERNNCETQYDLGDWKTNVIENLGPNWLAAILLSPLISSPLPRNGIDFPSIKDKTLNASKSK